MICKHTHIYLYIYIYKWLWKCPIYIKQPGTQGLICCSGSGSLSEGGNLCLGNVCLEPTAWDYFCCCLVEKIVYSAGAKCGFVPSLLGDFCWSILRKPFALGCHLPEYSAKITTLRLTLRSFHRRIHIYIYTYIHIYIYTYIHIYMCVQLYAFICVYDMDQKNIWIFQSSLLNE